MDPQHLFSEEEFFSFRNNSWQNCNSFFAPRNDSKRNFNCVLFYKNKILSTFCFTMIHNKIPISFCFAKRFETKFRLFFVSSNQAKFWHNGCPVSFVSYFAKYFLWRKMETLSWGLGQWSEMYFLDFGWSPAVSLPTTSPSLPSWQIPGQIRKRQTGLTIISQLITKFPPHTHQMPANASS